MITKTLSVLAAVTLLSSFAQAQVVTFGGDGKRESSSIFFFDQGAQKFVGSLELSYSAPVWKDEYNGMIKSKKQGTMRLGKDGWTRFVNGMPIMIGGVKLPAGSWCLGLAKQENGFSLMVLSAAMVQKKKIPSWETANQISDINIPLTHSQVESCADTLSMTLQKNGKDVTKPSFVLRWGKHKFTAAIQAKITVKKRKTFGGDK